MSGGRILCHDTKKDAHPISLKMDQATYDRPDAGEHSITITGIGNYSSVVEKTFVLF